MISDLPFLSADDAFQASAISEFLGEATIMKDFDHENVLRLIGVVIEEHYVYVVLPFMENGDLRTFISKPEQVSTAWDLKDTTSCVYWSQ